MSHRVSIRHYNGQKKRDRKTNNDLQHTTQKLDWETQIHLKPKMNPCVLEEWIVPAPLVAPVDLLLVNFQC
jgi:hypothetical protein